MRIGEDSFILCNHLSIANMRKYINTEFFVLFIMSLMNLLFVHYYFLQTIGLEVPCFKSSLIDNFIACLLDVSVVLLIAWIITLRRLRLSLAITFIVTLIWSFCNVFYARFFHQYLSWSSIGQAGNLTDGAVIDSMLAGVDDLPCHFVPGPDQAF